MAATASAGPENTASTSPFSQFRTQPERPSALRLPLRPGAEADALHEAADADLDACGLSPRRASGEFHDDGVDREAVAGLGEDARDGRARARRAARSPSSSPPRRRASRPAPPSAPPSPRSIRPARASGSAAPSRCPPPAPPASRRQARPRAASAGARRPRRRGRDTRSACPSRRTCAMTGSPPTVPRQAALAWPPGASRRERRLRLAMRSLQRERPTRGCRRSRGAAGARGRVRPPNPAADGARAPAQRRWRTAAGASRQARRRRRSPQASLALRAVGVGALKAVGKLLGDEGGREPPLAPARMRHQRGEEGNVVADAVERERVERIRPWRRSPRRGSAHACRAWRSSDRRRARSPSPRPRRCRCGLSRRPTAPSAGGR